MTSGQPPRLWVTVVYSALPTAIVRVFGIVVGIGEGAAADALDRVEDRALAFVPGEGHHVLDGEFPIGLDREGEIHVRQCRP